MYTITSTTLDELQIDSSLQLETVKLLHKSFFNDPLKRYFAFASTNDTDIQYFDIHEASQIPLMKQYCESRVPPLDPSDYTSYFEKSYWWEYVITLWKGTLTIDMVRENDSGKLIGVSWWKSPDTGSFSNVMESIEEYYVKNAGMECFDRVQKYWNSAAVARPPAHYYLSLVVVDPEYQRRGILKQLLAKWIEKSDQDNLPILLDTESGDNVPIYEHCGFHTLAAVEIDRWTPHKGTKEEVLSVYIMQRDPSSQKDQK
jgi:GNAT superfamily N-acetyltransferase